MKASASVLYVFTFDPSVGGGLWKGLQGRLAVWQQLGVHAEVAVCVSRSSRLVGVTSVAGYPLHVLTSFNSAVASRKLNKLVKTRRPDLLYMRYNLPYPSMVRVARVCPTVLEVHSDDRAEWRQRPARYRLVGEAFRQRLLDAVGGMVFVDPWLARSGAYPTEGRPHITIPNGIRIPADVPYGAARRREAGPVRLVLSVGSDEKWQGLDKYFALAELLPQAEFHVIGGTSRTTAGVPRNVIAHGRVSADRARHIVTRMDIGVGNLAMERIGRRSPSPLKVREYVAAGLPTVIAHMDPDLDGLPGMLNLGYGFNDMSCAAHSIAAFVEEWVGRYCPKVMASAVDLTPKERARVAYLSSMALRGRGGDE